MRRSLLAFFLKLFNDQSGIARSGGVQRRKCLCYELSTVCWLESVNVTYPAISSESTAGGTNVLYVTMRAAGAVRTPLGAGLYWWPLSAPMMASMGGNQARMWEKGGEPHCVTVLSG